MQAKAPAAEKEKRKLVAVPEEQRVQAPAQAVGGMGEYKKEFIREMNEHKKLLRQTAPYYPETSETVDPCIDGKMPTEWRRA